MQRDERLHRHARAFLEAAVAAVEPRRLTAAALARGVLPAAGKARLVAVGKAAAAMARGAVEALGGRLAGGVILTPAGGEGEAPPGFEVFGGGHPVPSEEGVAGARAIEALALEAGAGDAVLALVSGGGSALMTLPPPGVSLADVQAVTGALLKAGASIGELNCVRKHLDRLKGGRLARAAAPARLVALVLSDVVGDPLDVIASGPASPDPTTYAEAIAVLRRFGLWESAPPAARRHLERGAAGEEPESPKAGDPCFESTAVHVVGNNRLAAEAAGAAAEAAGYRALLLTTLLTGEAREVGGVLAALGREVRRSGHPLAPPACLVAAGETTVAVTGGGRGGRNQELALGAALALDGEEGLAVASLGTDGIDGPTDAAGAIADGSTLTRARARGLDPRRALADNDAHPFFQALGDLLLTGPTGTNVMDVQVVLCAAPPRRP